jgi:hypothetical protein
MEAEMKNRLLTLFAILMLTGCASNVENFPMSDGESTQKEEELPKLDDLGLAPELNNEIWLNSETPLRLADLRGKVVLLDMWTFG